MGERLLRYAYNDYNLNYIDIKSIKYYK